ATGTGDLALKFAQKIPAERIVGLDLSEGMLSVARKKASDQERTQKVLFVKGDSEALPFENDSFDAITVSFGIRNFENLEQGLSEIKRVLAPGGRFVILETSVPTRFPWKQGYFMYTRGILPVIGRLFSKDKVAYKYLSESASVFPFGEKLNNILRKIGFIGVENRPQTFGVATIYLATK
ncbi:MAG: ubiquinone/menaquinone biosynthesis methyltransferase, partial [Bacteroidota bacterium]